MDLYNTNFYLENNNNWYLDIPRIIANKSTKLWFGKGILLQSENEKLLNEWNNFYYEDKWFEKLTKFGIQNSVLGRALLLWMITDTGKLTLTVPTPSFMSRVAKINEQEQSAELFFTNNQSDNQTITWVTITPKLVKVEIFNDMERQTILGSTQSITKPDIHPKSSYTLENPFNFLPIVEITNMPNPLLFGQSTTLNGYPDCMSVYPLINDINHIIKQKRKERVLNQTRIYGKLSNEKLLDLMMGNTDISEYIQDAFMEVGTSDYDKTGNGGIQIIQGDPKFNEYWTDYNNTMKQIFNGSGYDYDEHGSDVYTNKTQSVFNNKFDMETTEFKIAHYKPYLLRMIDMWMIHNKHWDGKSERPYSFDFIPIAMTDQIQQDTLINSQLTNGTMSIVEAISQYRNVNMLQAKSILEDILKETKKLNKELGDNEDGNNEQQHTNKINANESQSNNSKSTNNKEL